MIIDCSHLVMLSNTTYYSFYLTLSVNPLTSCRERFGELIKEKDMLRSNSTHKLYWVMAGWVCMWVKSLTIAVCPNEWHRFPNTEAEEGKEASGGEAHWLRCLLISTWQHCGESLDQRQNFWNKWIWRNFEFGTWWVFVLTVLSLWGRN